MQPKDDISGALNLLRHFDRSLPQYQVPEAYFAAFPQRILQLITSRDTSTQETVGLPADGRLRIPFLVPRDYFARFPGRMTEKVATEVSEASDSERLKTPSPNRHPFRLGEDRYFETFPTLVLHRIRQGSDEKARGEALSPVLADLKAKNVFEVPQGYFDEEILRPALQKPLIVEHPAHRSIKWSSWIAAAGILLIFTLGGRGLFFNSSDPVRPGELGFEMAVSDIPEQEIAEYLEMTMSEYELAGFYADNAGLDNLLDEQARQQLLNDIPIEDIKAYIEGGGL